MKNSGCYRKSLAIFLHLFISTSQLISGSTDSSKIKVWPSVCGNNFRVVKKNSVLKLQYSGMETRGS